MDQNADYFYKRAEEKFLNDDFEGSLSDLNQAIQLEPLNPAYHLTRGVCLYKCNRYEQALVNFAKALELNDKTENSYLIYKWRASCNRKMGNLKDALSDYTLAYEISLDNEALFERGRTHYQIQSYDKALQDWTLIINSNKAKSNTLSSIYYHCAWAYYRLNDLDNSLAAFNQVQILSGQKPLSDSDYYLEWMQKKAAEAHDNYL